MVGLLGQEGGGLQLLQQNARCYVDQAGVSRAGGSQPDMIPHQAGSVASDGVGGLGRILRRVVGRGGARSGALPLADCRGGFLPLKGHALCDADGANLPRLRAHYSDLQVTVLMSGGECQ